ncbi:hypothetical protein FB451DRAFT_1178755 [Mycena latifolia]|nr:hypothetical protein FB451DRAFT_1178755 [Mycena latifolia]
MYGDGGCTIFIPHVFGDDMNYSSAIFKDFNEHLDPSISAGAVVGCANPESQANFKESKYSPGTPRSQDRWSCPRSCLAILAAKTFDCTVETIALSSNQADLVRKRIADANLTDRITVYCMDFREYWALKPDTGIGVVQGISIPETLIVADGSLTNLSPTSDFSVQTLNEGSAGRLIVDSNWDTIVAKALIEQYNMDSASLKIFKRKWILLCSDHCEAGFRTRALGDHIVTFTREGNVAFGCEVEI